MDNDAVAIELAPVPLSAYRVWKPFEKQNGNRNRHRADVEKPLQHRHNCIHHPPWQST
jgi:hypothetical protein